MVETNYEINGEKVYYKILHNGYCIYVGTTKIIEQIKPYIPDFTLSYEENALKQIKGLFGYTNLDEVKEDKIEQLSQQCNEAINQGATITFTEGVSEPFTYTINDQANISEMVNAIVLGAESYPYHANNEDCRMYSASEIIMMYSTLSSLKTHHLTYYNQLRAYVNSLTTAEEVYEVQYGQDLTGEYLDKYNTLMAQAQEEISKVLAAMTKNG